MNVSANIQSDRQQQIWEEVLIEHAKLINCILMNYRDVNGAINLEDLKQEVRIAVYKALLNRYDPKQGPKKNFLIPVIRGKILDTIRDTKPGKRWINKLGISVVSMDSNLSYDNLGGGQPINYLANQVQDYRYGYDPIYHAGSTIWTETRGVRRKKVSMRDRIILWLYFYEGMTQMEISKIFDLSGSAIHYILDTVIERLRKYYYINQDERRSVSQS